MVSELTQHGSFTEAERAFFHDNGFLKIRSLIAAAHLEQLQQDYDAAIRGDYGLYRASGAFRQGEHVHLAYPSKHIPGWNSHPFMRRSLAIARELLGPDMGFWFDQILMKPAGCMRETPWHQDAAHWQGRSGETRGLTCWIALADTDQDNGCLRFVPGSHRYPTLPHQPCEDRVGIQGVIEAQFEEPEEVCVLELKAGDASFHHSRTLHTGGGNRSSRDRKGLILHFAPQSLWSHLLSD